MQLIREVADKSLCSGGGGVTFHTPTKRSNAQHLVEY